MPLRSEVNQVAHGNRNSKPSRPHLILSHPNFTYSIVENICFGNVGGIQRDIHAVCVFTNHGLRITLPDVLGPVKAVLYGSEFAVSHNAIRKEATLGRLELLYCGRRNSGQKRTHCLDQNCTFAFLARNITDSTCQRPRPTSKVMYLLDHVLQAPPTP